MKLDNTKLIYIYAVVLFALAFLLTKRLITSFNTNDFDYFKIGLNAALLVYLIIKVVKLGKIENDKNDNDENE